MLAIVPSISLLETIARFPASILNHLTGWPLVWGDSSHPRFVPLPAGRMTPDSHGADRVVYGESFKSALRPDVAQAALCKNSCARLTSAWMAQNPSLRTHLATFSPLRGSSINKKTSLSVGDQCSFFLNENCTSA